MTQELASEDEIRAVIEDAFPLFINAPISIGFLGNTYRVMVKDPVHVWHTFNIPAPKMHMAIESLRSKENAS